MSNQLNKPYQNFPYKNNRENVRRSRGNTLSLQLATVTGSLLLIAVEHLRSPNSHALCFNIDNRAVRGKLALGGKLNSDQLFGPTQPSSCLEPRDFYLFDKMDNF